MDMSILDICLSSPCKNGGDCRTFEANTFYCICDINSGYQGETCEETNGKTSLLP
mgnify:CR=1 FL=1